MGILALVMMLAVEMFFLVWSIQTKGGHREEKGIVSIALLGMFGLLLVTGIYEWSFRYAAFLTGLLIQALVSIVLLLGKKGKKTSTGKSVLRFFRNSLIYTFVLSPAILFPQYAQLEITGGYEVATAKYSWSDTGRPDEFSRSGENRALTVEFWYPDHAGRSYPLIVFSHGAFGFSGSNYSTFAELASNGYIVASIGHTSHAFYTMDTNGKLTTVDPAFIKKAGEINASVDTRNEEDIYNTTSDWMKLRIADEHFVIDMILEQCKSGDAEMPFTSIDSGKIGLMGHSLGGASSAQIGRERDDIDAVIVLDGTMLGEEIAFENNAVVLNDTPYPVPLLNVYAEDHYKNSMEQVGDNYNNFHVTKNAHFAYETVFTDAGHLNFTDLPLFSPTLAHMLGVGSIDERYCIETMNQVVLEFFNSYLKDAGEPQIKKEY